MRILILIVVLFSFSCQNKGIDPIIVEPTPEELEQMIDYEIVQRDSFIIYFNDLARFHEEHFDKISILKKSDNGIYTHLDTVVVTYIKSDDIYIAEFLYGLKVNDEFLTSEYDFTLELRFYTNEKDFRAVSVEIDLYKFPYASSELVLEASDIFSCYEHNHFYISDFHVAYPKSYLVPRSSGSLVELNFTTHQCSAIYPYYTYITLVCYYDGYIYTDKCHDRIVKMNAETYEETAQIGQSVINPEDTSAFCNSDWYVMGLDIDDNLLYILHWDPNGNRSGTFISSFDLEGDHKETIHFEERVTEMTKHSGMAVYDGIIYLIAPESDYIRRYDIENKVFLKDLIGPSSELYSIQISSGNFYYSDYIRRIICVVPFDKLMEKD